MIALTKTQDPAALSEVYLALESQRTPIIRALLFSLLTSVLVLAPTIYMFEVYGRVIDSRSVETLLWLTLLLALCLVVMECLEWVRATMLQAIAHRLDATLSPRVFDLVMELNRLKSAPIGLGPLQDLKTVREFIYSPAVLSALELPTALIFLVVVYFINPVLGLVCFGAAVVQVLISVMNDKRTQPPLLAGQKAAVEAQRYADSSLRNAQTIQGMGMLAAIHRRWFEKQRTFLRLQAVASDRGGGFQAATKSLQLMLSSAILGLSAYLILENKFPGGPGMMIVASTLGGRILQPIVQLVGNWRSVVQFKDSYERLTAMLTHVPPAAPTMPLPAPIGHLQVEQLAVNVPGTNQNILRGIEFSLSPGQALAIVGPSACGKSTLVRALMGLWPAVNGKVRLDGADIHQWKKRELGPYLGYLPQSVGLLDGTVAENIARFGAVDMASVQEAAELVGLGPLIAQLPQGYDTHIGLDGEMLSGGQRQRLALARALYGSPRLIVLDEPNSSLDEAGDHALSAALTTMKARGSTIVVVTHRLSILSVVDGILFLQEGSQKAFGPRDQVLESLRKAAQGGAA